LSEKEIADKTTRYSVDINTTSYRNYFRLNVAITNNHFEPIEHVDK